MALGIVAGLLNLPIDERAIQRPGAASRVTSLRMVARPPGCVTMSVRPARSDRGSHVHNEESIPCPISSSPAQLRTAIGKFGGALAKVPAPELGATVIRALLAQSGLKPDQVSEVILGQVLAAGSGQNPARQALIKSGIPKEVPAMTINVVCGSGLKAVMLAAQAVSAATPTS